VPSLPCKFGFDIRERFAPEHDGKGWESYIEFAGLKHLTHVITLDDALCPSIIPPPTTLEEWDQVENFHDYAPFYWKDWKWLSRRIAIEDSHAIIAVQFNPGADDLCRIDNKLFELSGFDLMDDKCFASAITNCVGFFDVYARSDIQPNGLFGDLQLAQNIRDNLATAHPDEPHAQCNVWAIWTMRETHQKQVMTER